MRNHRIVHGNHTRGQVAPGIIALLLAALLATGCQTMPGGTDYPQAEARADSLASTGRHQDAARIYIALAGDAAGDERTRLTLLAVEEWLRADDVARARTAFASTRRPADADLATDWALTAARLDLAAGDAPGALERLASLDGQSLRVEQRLRRDALRGAALFDTGRTREALELLVRRELWLDDADAVRVNHEIIWAGLIGTPPARLEAALAEASNLTIRGWLELGLTGSAAADDTLAFRRGVVDWRRSYPGHPALADIVPSLLDVDIATAEYPRQIGVLLPLSGRGSRAGSAIRDGILGAWYGDFRDGGKPLLRFYDVAADGNVYSYRRAVEEGAEFVIGPLLKPSVMDLATGTDITLPTLVLNTLPQEVQAPAGLYQFALAPEDEAAQVARRAVIDDQPRGVALVPASDWGERVLDAFAASLDEAGGRLLDYRRYQPGVADFSDTIEDLLLLDESIRRYRRLRSVVGESVQFEPRRRGDIDFIFLAADGTTARLLRPQLRFHYAGNLPVYATSAVNERDGRSNNDLNGILFPEVPWIVSERSEVERVRSTYAELWPGSSPLSRLHAMGYDAYRLVGALQRAADGLEEPLQGMTGELTMDRRGVVHRRLPLATFEQGEIVAVAEPLPDIGDEAERPPGIDILLRDSDGAERPAAWDAQTDSD